MNGTITYVSTAADDRYATRIEISPSGKAHLTVGSNRDQRSRPVGIFDGTLPPPVAERVAAAARDPALASAQSQPSLVPDESYRRLEVQRASGEALDKIFGEELSPPPSFVNAERAIVEAIAYVVRSPVSALSLQISGEPSAVRAGATLQLTLGLDNPGSAALRIAAPAQWGADVAATLNVVRDDVSPDNFRPTDQRFVTLDKSAFVGTDAATRNDIVTIPPKGRALLRFRLPVDWPAGRYRLEVNLELAVADSNGRRAFEGALFSEPMQLNVQPR